MKNILTKNLVTLLVIVALISQSCSEIEPFVGSVESTSDMKVVNDRLSFASTKSYFETLAKVNEMTPDELSSFCQGKKFNSLLNLVDTVTEDSLNLKRLPTSYQVILNRNGEVIIGDTIVWYAPNGTKHFVPNLDEHELAKIRAGSLVSEITGTYSVNRVLAQAENSGGRTNTYIWTAPGANGPAQSIIHPFTYLNSPSQYKYVNELWNTIDGNTYTLFVVVKLEWKGTKWRVASEPRYASVSLTGSVQLYAGGDGQFGSTYISKNLTYNNLSGPWWIALKADNLVYSSGTYWTITLSGNIYQIVIADVNSAWTCQGNPIW